MFGLPASGPVKLDSPSRHSRSVPVLPLMLASGDTFWNNAALPWLSCRPLTLLFERVPENIETVERPAIDRPAPLFAWIVAFRTTAAEPKARAMPADGAAVELPLIVLAEGRPKPGSPTTAVDPLRTMP